MLSNQALNVFGRVTATGVKINLLKKNFDIVYPKEIWRGISKNLQQALLENLTFADTHALSLVLGKNKIVYNTNPPILENLLFRNQLNDLLNCEGADCVPHLKYVRDFYNAEIKFKDGGRSTLIGEKDLPRFKKGKTTAIVPFTFGKESLASVALCQEVGIEPILVYCQEPVQPYEEKYKLAALKRFGREFGVKYYFLRNDPGLFRYGKAFGLKKPTEIGWGTQTTVLAMLMVPFAIKHQAKYILFGSECANNEYVYTEGWKEFLSCDQTPENTNNQNNIVRLLTNNQCYVRSTFQPLDEINIFFMLHHRYPEYGKYQFSCSAEHLLVEGSQWCHKCYKCARMSLFSACCGVDYRKIGFKKDLMNEPHMFDHYFGDKFATGSNQELDFSFAILLRKKYSSPYVHQFAKEKTKQLFHSWPEMKYHFGFMKNYEHLPEEYQGKMAKIYNQELAQFRKILPR